MSKKWLSGKRMMVSVLVCGALGICLVFFSDQILVLLSTILSTKHIKPAALENIGSSIVAAVFLYLFYEGFAREDEIERVADKTSNKAVEEVSILYQKNFLERLPQKVYSSRPGTQTDDADGALTEFQNDHATWMRQSSRYWIKTTTGLLAAKSLIDICKEGHRVPQDVRFLLLDPRKAENFRHRAICDFKRSDTATTSIEAAIEQRAKGLVKEVIQTILFLFKNRYNVKSSVSFYSESVFYRVEIFQNGLFLTFYERLQHAAADNTFRFDEGTFVYPPFVEHFSGLFDNDGTETHRIDLTPALTWYTLKRKLEELTKGDWIKDEVSSLLSQEME